MDYERLVKERRRNWKALKPDEIRAREKEEERARKRLEREEKEKLKPPTGYDRLRRKFKERAEAEDKAHFQSAVRQGGILIGAFVLVIVFIFGGSKFLKYTARERYLRSMTEFDVAIVNEKIVVDLSNPVGALATWRSAWARGNMEWVVSIFSDGYRKKLGLSKEYLVNDYKERYRTGRFEDYAAVVENFEAAEMVRVDRKPWRDGELAIFRSAYLQRIGEKPPGKRYMVAFSWDAGANEWRFADLREDYFFNVGWKTESAIKPLMKGPTAPRFDITGKRILGNDRKKVDELGLD